MRRLRLALGVLVIVVAVGVVVSARREPTPIEDPTRGAPIGLAVGSAGTPAQLSVTVKPTPTLPIPEALPDNPYEPTEQIVLGTIEIPAIDVVADIQRGVTLTAINRGPGWWPGTAEPGEFGNMVVAGHRTTYSKPFARLDELVPGDQVIFTTSQGRYVYEVRGIIVVPGEWIDIAAQSEAHTATLFACHPPGSARERIVAKLRLLDDAGMPVDEDGALPAMDAEAQRTDHSLIVRDPAAGEAIDTSDPFGATPG